jgi:hypothetical protein
MQSSSFNGWFVTSLLRDGTCVRSNKGCFDTRGRLKNEDMGGTEQGSGNLGVDFHGEEETE